jgi:hypothetical protein
MFVDFTSLACIKGKVEMNDYFRYPDLPYIFLRDSEGHKEE